MMSLHLVLIRQSLSRSLKMADALILHGRVTIHSGGRQAHHLLDPSGYLRSEPQAGSQFFEIRFLC